MANFSNIVLGLLLIALAGGIYRTTRSPRIAVMVVIVFLVGLYLLLEGLGFVSPIMS